MNPIIARLRWIIVGLLLLCNGCMPYSLPQDLRYFKPYSDYVGQTLPLQRPVFVFYDPDNPPHFWLDEHPMISSTYLNKLFVTETNFGICYLPAGYTVEIYSVRRSLTFNGNLIQALGQVVLPGEGAMANSYYDLGSASYRPLPKGLKAARVRFSYLWGDDRTLSRAPWEPSTTPGRREVSRNTGGLK